MLCAKQPGLPAPDLHALALRLLPELPLETQTGTRGGTAMPL